MLLYWSRAEDKMAISFVDFDCDRRLFGEADPRVALPSAFLTETGFFSMNCGVRFGQPLQVIFI